MELVIDDYNALRRALKRMCDLFVSEGVSEEKVFDSRLIAFELVSNALEHGGGKAFLRAELAVGTITISVRGEKDYRPSVQTSLAAPYEESGRGLFLIDRLGERGYSKEKGVIVVIRY